MEKTRETRLFNCGHCPSLFWKSVSNNCPRAVCRNCDVELLALEKHEEIGYANFKCCDCGRNWNSSRSKRNVPQDCHKCHHDSWVLPDFVGPTPGKLRGKSENNHHCTECKHGRCKPTSLPYSKEFKAPAKKTGGQRRRRRGGDRLYK